MIEVGFVKVLPPGYEAQAHPEKPKCEECKGSGVVDVPIYKGYCKVCEHCHGTGVERCCST